MAIGDGGCSGQPAKRITIVGEGRKVHESAIRGLTS
jgi:hypothetical protein